MKNILLKFVIIISAVFFAAGIFTCEPDTGSHPKREYKEISFKVMDHFLENIFVEAIAFDSKGNAWLGCFSQGLIKYSSGKTEIFNSSNSIIPANNAICDVAVDKSDIVWAGSTKGLIRYAGNKFTVYDTLNSKLAEDIVWSIAVDNNNVLWLASSRGNRSGFSKFDGKRFISFTPQNSLLPDNFVYDIKIDEHDQKWLLIPSAYKGGYIVKITSDRWDIFSKTYIGYNTSDYGSIAIDCFGVLYCTISTTCPSCMPYPGIIQFDGSAWKTINPVDTNGNSLGGVQKISADPDGNLWASFRDPSKNYLAVYNGKKWFYNKPDFPKMYIYDIKFDKQNRAWLATTNGVYIIEITK